jgi:hypothetical protein
MVLRSWRSGDIHLPDVLAEHVTFSSPVADYHGRAKAAHMLGLIARVLESVEETAEWDAERETVCAFTARVDGEHLEGMLRERRDETGRLMHVTLFLRPYLALGKAIETMRELLRESPLPPSAT